MTEMPHEVELSGGDDTAWITDGVVGDKKVEACTLVFNGTRRPLSLVAQVLRRSGVHLGKIDEERYVIRGRVGSWASSHGFKLTVRIYPRRDMSLVELSCRGSWKGPGHSFLCCCLDALKRNLEGSMPVNVNDLIDWKSESFDAKHNAQISTDAVALLRRMEAGLE